MRFSDSESEAGRKSRRAKPGLPWKHHGTLGNVGNTSS